MVGESGMYLAYFFQALIALNGIYSLIIGAFSSAFLAFFALGLSLIPYFIREKTRITFPWFVYFLISLALWIHIAGYIQGYYLLLYPYYDKIAHLISGITVALLGFLGVILLDDYTKMDLRPGFIIGFTIIFSVAIGAFWEIYEFTIDIIFNGSLGNGPMQNDLYDTMLDMIFVLMGSVIVAFFANSYLKHHSKKELSRGMNHLSEL